MNRRADFADEVAAIKAAVSLVDVVGSYVKLKKHGREFKGLSPFNAEKTPSFTVVPEKGFWHCFSSGRNGDVFDFVQIMDGCDFATAKIKLAAWGGVDRAANLEAAAARARENERAARAEAERAAEWKRRTAAGLWRGARRIERGSVAWRYLAEFRGIDLDAIATVHGYPDGVPPTLRFYEGLKHSGTDRWHPCMVGQLVRADRTMAGIHRTYLADDGRGKADTGEDPAKMTLGPIWTATGRMGPSAPHLFIGESWENGLHVMAAYARRGEHRVAWSAVSLGNLAGRGKPGLDGGPHPDKPGKTLPTEVPDLKHPGIVLPATVERVTILEDADGDRASGRALIARACARFRAAGLAVDVASPPKGMDFDDFARAVA